MMREDLQGTFEAFRGECIWLRNCYNTFVALYESGEETQQALRETAVIFFDDLHRILIEYIFLQACKITDPAKQGKRENLTVEFLNNALKDTEILTDEIREHSKELMRYRGFLQQVRNRLISHIDKETALKRQPLGKHEPEEVDAFFERLQAYCDAVGNAVAVGPLDFRCSPGKGDVIDLIGALRRESEADHGG